MFESFRTRAQAVGAEVHRVPAGTAALDLVLAVLGREGVGNAPGERAVWCEGPILGPLLDRDALVRRFPGLSFAVTREEAADSRVGVTEFEWGLAATGTVAQDATDPRKRLASTLVETHVAVFPVSGLLPDLDALLARVDPARAAYLACVTGPSRTADIERVLTIGVHGPRKLVIVAVDGEMGVA